MTDKQLKEARLIDCEINACKSDIADIDAILNDYDSFGSTIEFKRNKDGFMRSFGSKKHNFREELKFILVTMRKAKAIEIDMLKDKFEKI